MRGSNLRFHLHPVRLRITSLPRRLECLMLNPKRIRSPAVHVITTATGYISAPPLKSNLPSNGNRKSKISISASTVWHLDTLLHNATTKDIAEPVDIPNVIQRDTQSSKDISATTLAEICSDSSEYKGRLFLDSGSEVSLVTRKLVKKLRATLIPHSMNILGISNGTISSTHKTILHLHSLNYPDEEPISVSCHVIDSFPRVNRGMDVKLHEQVMKRLSLVVVVVVVVVVCHGVVDLFLTTVFILRVRVIIIRHSCCCFFCLN